MSKSRQNLFFLMEPSEPAFNISMKAGNLCLNRFCIDEDAAFELSGVSYLETFGSYTDLIKGKEFSLLWFFNRTKARFNLFFPFILSNWDLGSWTRSNRKIKIKKPSWKKPFVCLVYHHVIVYILSNTWVKIQESCYMTDWWFSLKKDWMKK